MKLTVKTLFKSLVTAALSLSVLVSSMTATAVSAAVYPLPYADVNQDGAANTMDVLMLYAVVSGGDSTLTRTMELVADTDGNGTLDMMDVLTIYKGTAGMMDIKETAPTPSDYELEVLRLVNIEREKAGVEPLTYAYDLQLLADIRADELLSLFDHTRPDGRDCFSVWRDYESGDYWMSGENIGYGHRSPQEIVDGWMHSEGHRENLLRPWFTHMVIGCAQDEYLDASYNGGYAWAQPFFS